MCSLNIGVIHHVQHVLSNLNCFPKPLGFHRQILLTIISIILTNICDFLSHKLWLHNSFPPKIGQCLNHSITAGAIDTIPVDTYILVITIGTNHPNKPF